MTDELHTTLTREQLQRAYAVQVITSLGGSFQASDSSAIMCLADYIVCGFDLESNVPTGNDEYAEADEQDTPAKTPALVSPRTHREPPTRFVLVDKDGDELARKPGQDGWFYSFHGPVGLKWSDRELHYGPYQLKWANGGEPARAVAHQLSKWSSGVDPEPDRGATLVDESGAHWAHGPYGWQKDLREGGVILQAMGWGDTRMRAHTFTILDPEADK